MTVQHGSPKTWPLFTSQWTQIKLKLTATRLQVALKIANLRNHVSLQSLVVQRGVGPINSSFSSATETAVITELPPGFN